MGTEAFGYTLNRSSRMMQSHHILEDRSHQITFGQISRDDRIPLHSRGLKSLDHFWTNVPRWYNPSSFSRTEVTGSLQDKCLGMIQSHCYITTPPFEEGLSEQHQGCHESIQTLPETEASSTYQQLVHQYSCTGALWLPSTSYLECKSIGFLCASIYRGILGSLSSLYNFDYHIESQ